MATGVGYAAVTESAQAAAPQASETQVQQGRQLFLEGCATCHGLAAQGGDDGPGLIGVGAAAVDFQVTTGRMPLSAPAVQAPRKPPQYTEEQTAALAAYVASLGAAGDPLGLRRRLPRREPRRGRRLFRTNCAQCHNFAGKGGALSDGKYAPSLMNATPTEMFEAMITGPQNMPNFPNTTLPVEKKQAIIKYIEHLQSQADPAGSRATGSYGPVTEGAFIWTQASARSCSPRSGSGRRCDERHPRHGPLARGERGEREVPAPRAPPPHHRHRPQGRASRRAPGRRDVRALGPLHDRVRRRLRHDPDRHVHRARPDRHGAALDLALGLTFGLAILLIGLGAIQWAKKLMADEEIVDERHPLGSPKEDQDAALEMFQTGLAESGFAERKIVRRTLIGALALFPIPLIVVLKDMGPLPFDALNHTIWRKGSRIVVDVTGKPLRPEDLAIGTLVSASPEDLDEVQEAEGNQNARAKASIILVRMRPSDIKSQQNPAGQTWAYDGIVAYSKICTHVGCPVALYEQRPPPALPVPPVDVRRGRRRARSIFGPAARPLPQLPITVDDEGYLIAQSDFTEPVGPSFWERRMTTQRPRGTQQGLAAAPANYLDERTGTRDFVKRTLRKIFPDHWSFMLGEIALFSFIVLLLPAPS